MPIPKNPVYLSPEDQDYRLLKGVAELGVGPMSLFGMVYVTMSPEARQIPLAKLRYTFGPLLYHSRDGSLEWHSKDILKRWRHRVDIERLEILAGERPDLVSPTEIWIVMYNAIMTAPMHRPLTELYVWAGHRSAAAAPELVQPDVVATFRERLGNAAPVATDEDIFNGRLTHEYQELCRIILAKVVAAAGTTIRYNRRSSTTPAEAAEPT